LILSTSHCLTFSNVSPNTLTTEFSTVTVGQKVKSIGTTEPVAGTYNRQQLHMQDWTSHVLAKKKKKVMS